VLLDPNVAADGVTTADLVEQFEHNLRMRELTASVAETVTRVRNAKAQVAADPDKAKRLQALSDQLLNTPEGVRYNKPGLQQHVTYLSGMTTGADQKIGRDAIERYNALKKQLDDIKAELDKLLGPGR
jgi:Sec-independent protein translocase protein TatA